MIDNTNINKIIFQTDYYGKIPFIMNHTNWDQAAKWYDNLISQRGSHYHQTLIIPKLLDLLKINKGCKLLDVGCGQGQFCQIAARQGAEVTGIDASKKLIDFAKQRTPKNLKINYLVSDAEKLDNFESESFDFITYIMSISNIENYQSTLQASARILRPGGKIALVVSHPCFRIPRQSGWGQDEKRKLQYRRIDSYMSLQKIPIQMQPGYKPDVYTFTFHRPLSSYVNCLAKNNLLVDRFEELVSNRQSKPGKNSKAENRSRQEIPLFLILEAVKYL
jgi:ubiquinone/menaquinone biosynthesis C-methylase UbiE